MSHKRQRRSFSRRERRGRDGEQGPQPNLDLVIYLDDLADARTTGMDNLAAAGERALKILDRFLADFARSLGMDEERASMGDSIRFLSRASGTPEEIAAQAERFRETRNAVFHNPDVMLRPEAAQRILDGVEMIIRMAATEVRDLTRSNVVTTSIAELLADARDRMIAHGYNQLVVVDERGGIVDVLTERDIVVMEAQPEGDDEAEPTVGDAIGVRDHRAAVILGAHSSLSEAIDALRDERVGAVVLTQHGETGEPPVGIITRGDILKAM